MQVLNETNLDFDCKENITGSSAHSVKYVKPDGTIDTWSGGSVVNSNFMRHTIGNGLLTPKGFWLFQNFLTLADGRKFHGPKIRLEVKDNIS